MITLYHGSGASGFEVLKPAMSDSEWEKKRSAAVRLLHLRNFKRAAGLLRTYPFFPHDGTNYFNDDFQILWLPLPIEEYVKVDGWRRDPLDKDTFRTIAVTLNELGVAIRFVAADIEQDAPRLSVATPSLETTSDIVEQALQDVESLVRAGASVSGVDRIHTALHGYLIQACKDGGLVVDPPKNPPMTYFFKQLRLHPAFAEVTHLKNETEKLLNGMANALDALNPLRNSGSVAHPNEFLLEEAEALLAINSARTILHYIDLRIKTHKRRAPRKAK
jgi:hypothetical protein